MGSGILLKKIDACYGIYTKEAPTLFFIALVFICFYTLDVKPLIVLGVAFIQIFFRLLLAKLVRQKRPAKSTNCGSCFMEVTEESAIRNLFHGFPSGHISNAFYFSSVLLGWVLYRIINVEDSLFKYALLICPILMYVWSGFVLKSRIDLGCHTKFQAFSGAMFGIIFAIVATWIIASVDAKMEVTSLLDL